MERGKLMKSVWSCFAILFFAGTYAGQFSVIAQAITVAGAIMGGMHSIKETKRIQKSINTFNYLFSSIEYFRQHHDLPPAAQRELIVEDYIFKLSLSENHELLLTMMPSDRTAKRSINASVFYSRHLAPKETGDFPSASYLQEQLTTALFQARQRTQFYGWCVLIGAGFLVWEMLKKVNNVLPNSMLDIDDTSQDHV